MGDTVKYNGKTFQVIERQKNDPFTLMKVKNELLLFEGKDEKSAVYRFQKNKIYDFHVLGIIKEFFGPMHQYIHTYRTYIREGRFDVIDTWNYGFRLPESISMIIEQPKSVLAFGAKYAYVFSYIEQDWIFVKLRLDKFTRGFIRGSDTEIDYVLNHPEREIVNRDYLSTD